MGTAKSGALIQIVLVAGFLGTLSSSIQAAEPVLPTLQLNVLTYGTLDSADISMARQMVHALLTSAAIRTVWHECGATNGPCTKAQEGQPFVRVHLLPIANPLNPAISGDAMPAFPGPGIVRVYVPRVKELVLAILRTPGGRSKPALATLAPGHLVGMIIAHEVGHALGLRHAQVGVMKPEFGPDEIIAARSSALLFRPEEQDGLRRMLWAERTRDAVLVRGTEQR